MADPALLFPTPTSPAAGTRTEEGQSLIVASAGPRLAARALRWHRAYLSNLPDLVSLRQQYLRLLYAHLARLYFLPSPSPTPLGSIVGSLMDALLRWPTPSGQRGSSWERREEWAWRLR